MNVLYLSVYYIELDFVQNIYFPNPQFSYPTPLKYFKWLFSIYIAPAKHRHYQSI